MLMVWLGAIVALIWVAFHMDPRIQRVFRQAPPRTREGAAVTQDDLLDGVAPAGVARTPGAAADGRVHRSTWTARLVAPVFSALALVVILKVGVRDTSNLGDYVGAFWVLLALFGYGILFIWLFRVEIERDTLKVMTPVFFLRKYRLADLERIHEDGPFSWRLVFTGGRRPQVLKTVAGVDELRQRLAEVLKQNTR